MKLDICINGDCIKEMQSLDDNSIDLVVADPPYWKVVGEKWDYQWKTEKDYINFISETKFSSRTTLRQEIEKIMKDIGYVNNH